MSCCLGNTPAYAGKTFSLSRNIRLFRKHPRVCGEDTDAKITTEQATETPPRMRGRPLEKYLTEIAGGNTPAYAGKTPAALSVKTHCQKHPRVCGEDKSHDH